VVGIDADKQTVAAFIRKLRPVTLTRDTQVTNNFYSDGSAEAYQAILPKGTAVLADESGKPVARCRSGSPLAEPVELEKQTKCVNCPANYQPPPPCEGKCSRPEPDAPPAKPAGTKVTVDPIAASKAELEKCRKDKGDLKQCKTEYEKTRKQCDDNPLNPACDSSVCFDAIQELGTRACASYIDGEEILGTCLKLETAPKQACLKRLRDLGAKCSADPLQKDCVVDPKIKAYRIRQQCIQNPAGPACQAVQDDCTKNPQQFRCDALKVAINDAKQKCQLSPALPVCKNLPKVAARALKGEDKAGQPGAGQPDPGQPDQQPGAGDGQQPGAEGGTPDPGQAPPGEGSGGTPQPEGQTPAP